MNESIRGKSMSASMLDVLMFALSLKRPHGYEDPLRDYLCKLFENDYWSAVDTIGNLHVRVGDNPTTLFVAHMDTVHKTPGINTFKVSEDGNTITADKECLGADDGAGVAILYHLITHNVTGHYVFTVGEEVGLVGARHLSETFLSRFLRSVSFDRRGTNHLITHQLGAKLCSDEFAEALIEKLDMGFVKTHGVFTDNSEFSDIIPEIVNISAGYKHEHTNRETLDVAYLKALSEVVVTINWEELPVGVIVDDEPTHSSALSYLWEPNFPTEDEDKFSDVSYVGDYIEVRSEAEFDATISRMTEELQKSLGLPLDPDSWEAYSIREVLTQASRIVCF